ncbi:hypothetical protein PanWU01x14_034160, partial [Parasponia andersonii]
VKVLETLSKILINECSNPSFICKDDITYSDATRNPDTGDDIGHSKDPIGDESSRANRQWNFLKILDLVVEEGEEDGG